MKQYEITSQQSVKKKNASYALLDIFNSVKILRENYVNLA